LRGIRERIENAGGALTIESGAGRGFALTAFLPSRSAQ
jgi:signal transduction histidine kinase